MGNSAGSSLSKHMMEEKQFIPIDGGALSSQGCKNTCAPVTTQPSITHIEKVDTHQTNLNKMTCFNRRPTSKSKGASENSNLNDLLQNAVLMNLHSLLETSDSSVHLNSYSSMESDSAAIFRTASLPSPKFPETLHFAAIRDQMLLDISKTMTFGAKSLGDLASSSSVSLNSFSFEHYPNLTMKGSDSYTGLDVINEEEMSHIPTNDNNESHECDVEANNSLLTSNSSMIKSPGHEYSKSEKILRCMRETFMSKLRTAFFDMNGFKEDDSSETSHGYKMNVSKDDDDTLVTATTVSESCNGYSSCESASPSPARADSDISCRFEPVAQPEHEHHCERSYKHASTSEDKSRTMGIPKYRFESLYEHGKLTIYRNRELELYRRINEKKKNSMLEMRWRKKQAARRSSWKPISKEDICPRLYTERSYIMNESGKELRDAIIKKSYDRNERGMKIRLY